VYQGKNNTCTYALHPHAAQPSSLSMQAFIRVQHSTHGTANSLRADPNQMVLLMYTYTA